MKRIDLNKFDFWKSASFVALLSLIVFSLRLTLAPLELSTQYIPDDAFYYLTLARNFSDLGQWTFDSGVSLTCLGNMSSSWEFPPIHNLITISF